MNNAMTLTIAQSVVSAVLAAQVLFDASAGEDKKKYAVVQVVRSLYDVADTFLNLDEQQDRLIKETVIPQAIEVAVSFFKQNGFTFDHSSEATKQVLQSIEVK